jgi:hypothetical protein
MERNFLSFPANENQRQYFLRNFSSTVSTAVFINAPYDILPPSVTGVAQPSSFSIGQMKSYLDASASCVGVSDVTTAWDAFRAKILSSASPSVISTGTASPATWSSFVNSCLAKISRVRYGCFTDSSANLGAYKFVTYILGLDDSDMDSLPSLAKDVAGQLNSNAITLASSSPFSVRELAKPNTLGNWTFDLD